MIKKRLFKTIFILALFVKILYPQDFTKVGSSAAQFLKIPIGAKAVSLGSTFTSISDDITAMYWNPAGLPQIKKFTMGFTHIKWIGDMSHNFFGMLIPIDGVNTVGASVIQLASGQIENTTILQPKGTGIFFDARDLAVSISYARQVIEQVSIGITGKYINQRIWNSSAQTIAFDVGVLLKTGYNDINLGFTLQNFGPELKMSGSDLIKEIDLDPNSATNPAVESQLATQPFALPTSYRGSISLGLISNNGLLQIPNSTLLLAADAFHSNDYPERYSVGAEYGFLKTFFVRGGYVFNTDEEGLSLGAGIDFNFGSTRVIFDYAFSEFGVFNSVHTFSVGLGL